MAKKFILFVLILVFRGNIFSQAYCAFPSDSAFWMAGYSCSSTFCPPGLLVQPGFTQQNGDTILNGLVYHKLYEKTSGYILNSFYRESNKKIYLKYPLGGIFGNDTSEFLLYDFNMTIIGDSFKVKVPSSWISSSGPLIKQPVLYLSWTGSININSVYHKTYNFSSNNCTSCPITMQWIEGVGSISGFFYNLNYKLWASCLSPPAPYYIYLLCFGRNYYNFSYTPGGCAFLGTNELNVLVDSKIYPNPFDQYISVMDENRVITNINITSVLGQKQNVEIVSKEDNFIINTNNLPPGIYVLTIFSDDQTISKKIVKTD